MSQEPTSIPVPTAIRQLIVNSNTLLQSYQQELSTKVQLANREMMQILGLNPENGWRLDIDTMTYVKGEPVSQDDSPNS